MSLQKGVYASILTPDNKLNFGNLAVTLSAEATTSTGTNMVWHGNKIKKIINSIMYHSA